MVPNSPHDWPLTVQQRLAVEIKAINKQYHRLGAIHLLLTVVLLTGCTTAVPQKEPSRTFLDPTPTSSSRIVLTSPEAQGSNSALSATSTVGAIATPPSSSPTPQLQSVAPDTNISQAEFEQALLRWQAHCVSEYVITVDAEAGPASPGKVRLHIKIQNGKPQVVGYTNLNGEQPQVIPLDTLSSYDRDFLQSLSVERLFQLAGEAFASEARVPAGYNIYYNIAFDPILGYPTLVAIAGSYNRVLIHDGASGYEVLDLQILKSSAPGMPKTGHPGP